MPARRCGSASPAAAPTCRRFPQREGGLVLNATIDRYAYGLLRPRRDRQVRIESADFGLSVNYRVDEPPIFDGRLDLVKAAIRRLGDPAAPGYDIFLHSERSSRLRPGLAARQ